MAEQCIVCLDNLLHAGEEPPPPPLPGGRRVSSSKSPSGQTSTSAADTAITATASSATTTTNSGGPSTTLTAPEKQNRRGEVDDAADGDVEDGIAKSDTHTEDAADDTNIDSRDDDNVAVIQICGHALHDTCLREWTAKANSCPICRQSFHLVNVYDKIGGKLLSTYTVEDKKQVAEFDPQAWLDEYAEAEEEDISTPCPVCNLADHEEVLLLCDGCDTPYHTHCIGLDSVPEGAWFCMECVDLLGPAVPALSPGSPIRRGGRRTGNARARNDFFPRTRHTMRRARRRGRSDDWQGAWGQITGHIWDVLNIDLDHDEDEALEEYRRVERLRDNERREFERWQERLDIARRLGAQDIFERNIPSAILHHATRNGAPSQSSSANARTQVAAVQQSQEERRAWGDFERARECEQTTAATPNTRKRKSRSVTASPVEPPQEPERKLKRPRTRRIGAPSESASLSKSPALVPAQGDRVSASAAAATSAPAGSTSAAATNDVRSPRSNGEPPSFLSSLLKEVEMSTPSDDENIRSLFGDPPPPAVDPSSPAASSPTASAHNSPRAMSTTPPPHRSLRPSSPTLLSSHILPVYPPANYSPTRSAASPGSAGGGGGDNSDSEGNAHTNGHTNGNQHRSPSTVEIRQPRPRRMPTVPVPRSQDTSPTRNSLSLEMKESISSMVRTALNPHWKSSQLTADQYAAINRDVSRKLYEEVTDPAAVDIEARKLWEQKANREVARAIADLQA